MKKRVFIAISLTTLIFVLTPIALLLLELRAQGLFMISSIVSLVFVAIYLFGGIPKLITYSIYSIAIALFLLALNSSYHLPLVLVATIIFVLNPLAALETYLGDHLDEEYVLPLNFSIRGTYWPFFLYQKEMKNYYHLPQATKLYTKKWYLNLRQLSTLSLLLLGIFLFIHSINSIANSLYDFRWNNFFIFYVIVIIFLMTYFVFKKGFLSTYRLLSVSVFPPIIYMALMSGFPQIIRYIFAGSAVVIGIIVSTIEIVKYYRRIAYDSYNYYDVEKQVEVFANALFEPLVYNETYTLCGDYTINISLETFHKEFEDILIYANFHKFIITAYTQKKDFVTIYAHFHYKKGKRAHKFQFFLEQKFRYKVNLNLYEDPNKQRYEKEFFHNHNYIVTRAQNLALLLKELDINTKITISFIAYFNNKENLEQFNKEFPVVELTELNEDDYLAVSIAISCLNVDYVIEEKVRAFLLALLIHKGSFVRVTVYY